jgi:hypothetical protein
MSSAPHQNHELEQFLNRRRGRMPLFFFSVRTPADSTFEDEEGMTLQDVEQAYEYAKRMAAELAHDDDSYVDAFVIVEDEERSEVARVQIRSTRSGQ